jgi:hypothetical protein
MWIARQVSRTRGAGGRGIRAWAGPGRDRGWAADMLADTTTPAAYAAAVVGEVSKRRPKAWFWTGATTSIVRWGDMLLPRTYWDGLFTKWFNLDKVKAAHQARVRAG